MKCLYCNRVCKNENSLRNHERLCKLNPNRQVLKSNLIEYNKKRKDLGIPGANQFTKAKKLGISMPEVSDETKQKLSKSKGRKMSIEEIERRKLSMRMAVLKNPSSYTANNVSGRTPIIIYKGFKLKGTWELLTAKWLDANNIKWTNILKGFNYEWEGSTHIYYPDFYLTEYDRYIEVKGYERERDRAKWKVVRDLIVIKKNEIEKIKENTFELKI